MSKILSALNPFSNNGPVDNSASINRGMSDKYKASMIGTAGAGKTVISNMIFYVARTMQQQLPGFYCDVDDFNSTIKNDVCLMESGHFPPKTKAYNSYAYQTALRMWWNKGSFWGQKAATFQVCDLAGEDLIAQSNYNFTKPDPSAYSQAAKLVDYIYNSEIFILVAPASRAPIFDGDESVEREDADLAFNPDVRLSSVWDLIVKRRVQNNKPIKGIALCLSKCDMVDKYVQQKYGWDLYCKDPKNPHFNDKMEFLKKYFPWTTMTMKSLSARWPQTEVIILPMYVETVKNGDGTQKKWETGSDAGMPMINSKDRVIQCSTSTSVDLINFIGRLM